MSSTTTAPDQAPQAAAAPRRRLGQVRVGALAPYVGLALLLLVWFLKQHTALSLNNINLQISAALVLALAAAAQTVVILSGGIDLSIAGVISLTTCVFATRELDSVGSVLVWGSILVVVGGLAGMVNGLLIAYFKLESFVVTLATWSILTGIALFVLPTDGGSVPEWYVSLASKKTFGLNTAVWLFVALALVAIWFKRSRPGTAIRAIGSDRTSAYLSGVPVNLTTVSAFTISGIIAALAGLYLTTQTASGSPTAGDPYILTSITAVVIGGTSLAGGKGGIGGSLVGAIIVTILASIVFSFQISSFWTPLLIGVLLIVSVVGGSALDAYSKRTK